MMNKDSRLAKPSTDNSYMTSSLAEIEKKLENNEKKISNLKLG